MDLLLFGLIAEKAGGERSTVEAADMPELRTRLLERMPFLAGLSFAIAVDRQVVNDDRPLYGAREIALLPPFAGG